MVGTAHAAVADALLVLLGPAMIADARSGQVDDRVEPVHADRVEHAAIRVPLDLARAGVAPHERHDVVPALAQVAGERAADQPGCAGDADLHELAFTGWNHTRRLKRGRRDPD